MVTGRQVPEVFPLWIWAPLVFGSFWLFPLSFAYAVLKHRVLEIPVLLKRSARFLMVQWGVHILGILLTIVFALLLGRAFSRMISGHPEISVIPAIALGGLILWLGIVVGRPVNKRIDRAFFRSSYDARQILEDLAEKTRTSTGREQLASLLENHIQEALHPASLAVYLGVTDGRLHLVQGNSPSGTIEISVELPPLVELAKRGQPWEVPPNFEEKSISTLMTSKPECLVPILGSGEGQLQGLLVLGPRLSEETYSHEDKRLLASVASQTAGALRSISLAEKIAEQLEVERRNAVEMQVAKEVQDKLLPQSAPVLKTLECAGRCIQTRSVGGDYYDFLELGPQHVGHVLGDVSGKGISAALLMANLQANLRSSCAVSSGDIALQLSSVNHQLRKSSADGYYATLFFADYDDATRRLVYSNCGHNPPVLLRADGKIERLTATATVIGLFEKWQCLTQETTLHPGDLLAIYSDGVTEAMNQAGEEFGETRFIASLREFRSFAPALLLANVVSMVQKFAGGFQSDDLTLVIARAF
jgi:sigma-B regulation protein RsbU (phosphoserine phosphatase)